MTFEDTHVFRIGADIVGSFRVVGAFGHPALDEFTSGWCVVRESTSEAEKMKDEKENLCELRQNGKRCYQKDV